MKKVLVVYYSQTGQLKEIIDNLTEPILSEEGIEVDFYKIKPLNDYSFPWKSDDFFDTMPECVKKKTIDINLSDFPEKGNYDLVILAYQVWFLSPSIPFTSFIKNEKAKKFLDGKKVITILGIRNMWVVAQDYIKNILDEYNAQPVGNLVFADKVNNIVSVLTIKRWLLNGKKEAGRFLPEAGVSKKDIASASKFSSSIIRALKRDNFENLQNEFNNEGGVFLKYYLMQMEKNAYRIFKIWAKLISKKGGPGDPKRLFRVRVFKNYLLFMIFVLSPFASLIFQIKRFLLFPLANKEIRKYRL